jgi:NAD(P)-dependent dehydrogenase (short-subunit alcohol dehydrogenase family)
MSIALSQKTALVTGSSRGIGRGIALKLAEHGVKKIAINYNENEPAAQDALRKLRGHGADGFVIKADVGNVEDIKRMFAEVKAEFGSLDIYVSNARATLATGFYQTPMEIPLENFQATYDSQVREFLVATRLSFRASPRRRASRSVSPRQTYRRGNWVPSQVWVIRVEALESAIKSGRT